MRRVFQVISWLSLAGTILPSLLFLAGHLSLDQSKMILLLATLGWFVHTPLWMGRARKPESSESVTSHA